MPIRGTLDIDPVRSPFLPVLRRARLPMQRLEACPMRRRDFIAGLGSSAAWPPAARAQQQAMSVIGYLAGGTLGLGENEKAFRNALAETGYVEGRNLSTIDYGDVQFERLPELARIIHQA
jgi:hypothetical protein